MEKILGTIILIVGATITLLSLIVGAPPVVFIFFGLIAFGGYKIRQIIK